VSLRKEDRAFSTLGADECSGWLFDLSLGGRMSLRKGPWFSRKSARERVTEAPILSGQRQDQ